MSVRLDSLVLYCKDLELHDSRPAAATKSQLFCIRRWFEVDQADVIQSKEILLSRMGAAIRAEDNAKAQIPLAAAECHRLSADLSMDGWPAELEAKGFSKAQPTLWHAEGLLNYLSPGAVEKLLKDLSMVHFPVPVETVMHGSLSTTCSAAPQSAFAEQNQQINSYSTRQGQQQCAKFNSVRQQRRP